MRIIGNNPAADNAEITAVASGTLPDGKAVVVNSDGTVSAIVETPINQAIGSPSVFESGSTLWDSSAFDSNSNKIVIAYRDSGNANRPKAVVGTVSGTSISFGTPVQIASNAQSVPLHVVFDSNSNKIVVYYSNPSNQPTARVGTVSGTSISFGGGTAGYTIDSGTTYSSEASMAFDSSSNKIVVAYKKSSAAYCKVGTVSGTAISWGSAVQFDSLIAYDSAMTFDSNSNKIVIVYSTVSQSIRQGYAIVGTVSGTSISFVTRVAFDYSDTRETDVAFDSVANKIIVVYKDRGNSNYGTAIVGTVSGTTISFGTPAVFESAKTDIPCVAFDPIANKFVIAYADAGNSGRGTVITGTITGTSLSFDSPSVFSGTSLVIMGSATYDSNSSKVVLSYTDGGNSVRGTSVVYQPAYVTTNLTSENYIGMSSGVVDAGVLDTSEFQDNNTTQYVNSVYDVNAERVVIAYLNNDTSNGTGGCIVGTISGSSISFGSFTTFSTGTQISDISLTYDSTNNKCVVSYQFPSSTGQSKVATVDPSDNSITFGSASQFSSESEQITSIFDDSSGKVVLAFRSKEASTEFDILARVGTVSGTSISWGTVATVSNANSQWVSLGNDVDSNKIVFAYLVSSQGRSKVGTVSGTNISFGNEATFTTNATYISSMAYHDALNRIILTYRDSGNSNYPTSVVGTLSGTSISFGTPVVLNSAYGNTSKRASAYNPSLEKVFTVYGPSGGSVIQELTASGTTLVKGDTTALGHAAAFQCLTYISSLNTMLITYRGTDDDGYATLFVPEVRGEVPSGSQAIIDIGSAISTNQISLTAGQQYFVQTDGTLSLTADDPSVIAGTAVSATDIIVKG